MSGAYKKIKIGQTTGDLPPEEKKKFPGAKEVVRRKTRAQQREIARLETTNPESQTD